MFMQKGRAPIGNDYTRVMGRRYLCFCKMFTHHFQTKTAAKWTKIEQCELHHHKHNSKYFNKKITPQKIVKLEGVLYPWLGSVRNFFVPWFWKKRAEYDKNLCRASSSCMASSLLELELWMCWVLQSVHRR